MDKESFIENKLQFIFSYFFNIYYFQLSIGDFFNAKNTKPIFGRPRVFLIVKR